MPHLGSVLLPSDIQSWGNKRDQKIWDIKIGSNSEFNVFTRNDLQIKL